ncbi:MAG: hypothetical protein PHW10_01975 [Candidatus Peribacteraceae bacterium]|nr:hypothetical protein [Candidatus Peribacteraceae bacterium]
MSSLQESVPSPEKQPAVAKDQRMLTGMRDDQAAAIRSSVERNPVVARLFERDGRTTEHMQKLLSLFGIEGCGTVEQVRDATQRQWYQAGKLRAEIIEHHAEHREQALSLLRQMGFFDAVHAESRRYEEASVLGATVVAVRKRLAFLMQEWERGVRFSRLSFLGSARPLLKDKESEAVLLNPHNAELPFPDGWTPEAALPSNEAEMMRMVLEQAEAADTPWRGENIVTDVFCSQPRQGRNANTADTLRDLQAARRTAKGDIVLVSSQPFVPFQDVLARNTLPFDCRIITVGPAGGDALPISVHLDNLAKIVYEIAARNDRKE